MEDTRDMRRGWGRGGPWREHGHGGGRRRRGDIRTAVLAALEESPAHGYEIIQRFEEKTAGMWRPSAGSIYPTLQLLEDEGLVRSYERDGKKVYELTDEGRAAAARRVEEAGQPLGLGSDQPQLQGLRRCHAPARARLEASRDDRQPGHDGQGRRDPHRRPQADLHAPRRELNRSPLAES